MKKALRPNRTGEQLRRGTGERTANGTDERGAVDQGVAALRHIYELVNSYPGLLQDVRRRGSFHGTMGWNGKFEGLSRCVFLETDMAPFLPHDNPSVPLKCSDDPIIGQLGNLAHTVTSTCSAWDEGETSSSTGSR